MVHTARDEAGRRRGGQGKCTIQITIKVQLYIPQETYGLLCYRLQAGACVREGAGGVGGGGAATVVPFSQLFSYRRD